MTARQEEASAPPPTSTFYQDFYPNHTFIDPRQTMVHQNHQTALPMHSSTVYPQLNEKGKDYRLNHINDRKAYLDLERRTRENLKKKYTKADRVVFGTECTFAITELALTVSAFIFPPMVLIAGPVCLGLTIANRVCRHASNALSRKASKHSDIELMAKAKLNSIENKFSKAMADGTIDEKEFTDICDEVNKYDDLKEGIMAKYKYGIKASEITMDVQQSLIDRGKNMATEEIKNNLKKNLNM